MSFAGETKGELCRTALNRKCCTQAEAYGVLLYCNPFSGREIRIITANDAFAQRLPKLFRRAFSLSFDHVPPEGAAGKRTFLITAPEKILSILEVFGQESAVSHHINYGMLETDCCRQSFFRGAFLAGGSVTDPDKRYHLELLTSHPSVSREAFNLMLEMGFAPKDAVRSGGYITYFKQSEAIEDVLTTIGAPLAAMGIMQAKMQKDMRNAVNRRVNCETANLTKVVDASMGQMAAIRALEEAGELDKLPGKLRETALLRKENPEATLQELAAMLEPPITKSAINHRMRKLLELARALEE